MNSKILIVEDDALSRTLISKALTQKGHRLVLAASGEEALELLDINSDIDIIILDWILPGIDGLEVCRQIRQKEKDSFCYIIMLTSREGRKILIDAYESGADDFAVKPFKLDEMEARIKVGQRVVGLEKKLKKEHDRALKYAKRFETLAKERAKQLIHADRMASIGMLSAGIAHEVNNPTTFISGNIQTLDLLYPVIKKHLEAVDKNHKDFGRIQFVLSELPAIIEGAKNGASRISKIVSGLKSFSRHGTPQTVEFFVSESIENAFTLCQNAHKQHKVNTEISPDLPALLGDPQQIEQVLVNLIINAAQALENRNDGKIDIIAKLKNDKIVVIVADNGPGIPTRSMDHIWDPFFTTKPVGTGTGLGLSISQGIIESHGGTIIVSNKESGGAMFTIELPIKK